MTLSRQVPVAVFLTAFEPGGTERQMLELVRRLDRQRFAVHLACFHRRGAWLPRAVESAVTVVEFPIRGFAHPGMAVQVARFARWCRRQRIAVLQACDLYANVFALPAAALAGVPVRVGSRRELNPDKTAGQIRLQRQAYRCATRIVANSPAARAMLEQEGVPPGVVHVIPNGLDPAAFPDGVATPERPLRTLIIVANLRQEKGHDTLIAAAARLAPEFPELRLRIVGDGPRRGELEELARTSGLERQVEFLGHRDDVPALLAASDLFVLPSRSEAFPNGAIEAMAAGLPVVATAAGGLLDLIESGRTGVLVRADDPGTLADALRSLLRDPARARRLGLAARAHVLERYSFDRMVRGFEDIYMAGLTAGRAAAARRVEAAGI